jgi:DNA primase
MASDTVQQIKDKLSIVDVVSQYVKLERSGGTLRARCPFHAEKTPSFHVSADRGTYHCFGCNVGGDIFSFVEAIEGLDFKGALKILADKAGVPIEYHRGKPEEKDERERLFELMEVATIFYASRLDEAAKTYLKQRGVLEPTMHAFRIGWAGNEWSTASDYLKAKKFSDKEIVDAGLAKKNERGTLTDKFRNRILFPIADSAGRIVAFSGRSFGEHASPEAPKYLNSPETPLFRKSRILYGFDRAKIQMRKANCAVLVEGQMDLVMSHQAGWSNTLAVSGTAFTEEHANLIKRMTDNLVLALDADAAGIKAAGRAARAALAAGLNVKVARIPDGLDPADLILKEGAESWRAAIREAKDIITFLLDVLQEHAPQQDRFRRVVESVVLPFLADVKSPIAREQYLREVSARLGVSLEAVTQALARVPTMEGMPGKPALMTDSAQPSVSEGSGRAKHAFALLLWQSSLPKPQIDLKEFRTKLEEALGAGACAALDALAEPEREALRFSAERLYGESRNVSRTGAELLKVVQEDRLRHELIVTTRALERAEAAGQSAEATHLEERSKLLTGEIARLHKEV